MIHTYSSIQVINTEYNIVTSLKEYNIIKVLDLLSCEVHLCDGEMFSMTNLDKYKYNIIF